MIKIGKIVNTQGLKGEVRVLSNSDFKEERFKVGQIITVKTRHENLELEIEKKAERKNFIILKFKNYDKIEDVEKFKNCDLVGEEIEITGEDGNYSYRQLTGLEVYNLENLFIGTVKEVRDYGYVDMLLIENNNQKHFIPYIDEFIINVDIDDKKIIIKTIPGLLNEN